MISLRRSLTELDQAEALLHAASEAYREALQAVRDNVVEVEPRSAARHRECLEAIVRSFDPAAGGDSMLETTASLRAQLHGYQSDAHRHLEWLNGQLASTVRALQDLMASLAGGAEDQQECLQVEMERLKMLSGVDDLPLIRAGLRDSMRGISGCIEQIQRQNQLVVAQLQDEIRTLHSRLETAEHLAAIDPVTGLMNRREVEAAIRRQVTSSAPLCLIFVWIRNLKMLQRQYGHKIADDITVAACRNFAAIVENRGTAGRWSDDELIAMVNIPKAEAMRLCRDLPGQLRGPHECMQNGRPLQLLLQITSGVVEARPNEQTEHLLDRADTLIRTLAGN